MGKLTNLNPPALIADADIPAAIARDSEVTAAVAAHVAAVDPHPTYLTQAEGDGRYRQTTVALTDTDIPAAIARDAEIAVAAAAHVGASDPHPIYLTEVEADANYPKFKRSIVTGNCPTEANGTSFINHGLTDSRIRAFSAMATIYPGTISESRCLPGGLSYSTANRNYSVDIGNGQIRVRLGTAAQSSGIFGAPITIVIDHV